jgi:DNA polymerase III delta prime subunit
MDKSYKERKDLIITKEQEEQLANLLATIVKQSNNNRTDEESDFFAMVEHGFMGSIINNLYFVAKNYRYNRLKLGNLRHTKVI